MKISPLVTIVLANLATLVAAVIQGWGMAQLLWPFWAQSVIIGLYATIRLARAAGRDIRYPLFFLVHYGGFHAAYLFFLVALATTADADGHVPVTNESTGEIMMLYAGTQGPIDFLIYAVLAVAFWIGHRSSHRQHVASDLASCPGLARLMMLPYVRIVPMHLTLIFGVLLGGTGTIIFFGLLKTAADVGLHKFEHHILNRSSQSS
jgi:hypothetical protein